MSKIRHRSEEELAALLLDGEDFNRAMAIFESVMVHHQGITFAREWILDGVAEKLGRNGRRGEVIALRRLAVDLFPSSFAAFEALADAYRASGDTERAFANYRKSLELEPRNASAVAAIARLKRGTK